MNVTFKNKLNLIIEFKKFQFKLTFSFSIPSMYQGYKLKLMKGQNKLERLSLKDFRLV
jgi:hypothetical protein